jgi:hypothetical protein
VTKQIDQGSENPRIQYRVCGKWMRPASRDNEGHRFQHFCGPLRARIEQTIGKLKRFKRVAMRDEKTDISCPAIISFACG